MPSLNCTKFEQLLNETVEAHLPVDDAALRDHAGECDHCRTLWEQHAVLERAISHWKNATPCVDLTDSVLARLAFESHESPISKLAAENRQPVALHHADHVERRAPKSLLTRWNAVAASLAAVAVVTFLLLPQYSDNNRPTVARQQITTPDNNEPGENTQGTREVARLDRLVPDATSAYGALAAGAVEAVREATVLVPANSPADTTDPQPPVAAVPSKWVDEWGRELKPIGDDVSNAIASLFDAVPF